MKLFKQQTNESNRNIQNAKIFASGFNLKMPFSLVLFFTLGLIFLVWVSYKREFKAEIENCMNMCEAQGLGYIYSPTSAGKYSIKPGRSDCVCLKKLK